MFNTNYKQIGYIRLHKSVKDDFWLKGFLECHPRAIERGVIFLG